MQAMLLVYHIEGGIFMACKIKRKMIIFCISFFWGCVLIFVPYFYVNFYKQIIFFDYSFENKDLIIHDFEKLGFKYNKFFIEYLEKKHFFEYLQIMHFSYNDRNCVILLYDSKNCKKKVMSLLNNKAQMRKGRIYLPDDLYSSEQKNVYIWTFEDRIVYFSEDELVNKIYIEAVDSK